MAQVVTFGELLIDFVPTLSGVGVADVPTWQPAPGGAPANVAVGLARLGVTCGFVGQVGADAFGYGLARTLADNGVDTTGLRFSAAARTALAFVSLQADGERDFLFYRNPSADMLLRPDQIDPDLIAHADLFHYGSISAITELGHATTLHALNIARQHGLIRSYDPNLRLPLWPSTDAARRGMLSLWPYANIIKVSEEELVFLSGIDDPDRAARHLWHADLRLLLITRGRAGCGYVTSDASGDVPPFIVQAIDATGAGDSFMAALLAQVLQTPNLWDDPTALRRALRFANAAGALTTTRHGAIPALPTSSEVTAFLTESQEPGS